MLRRNPNAAFARSWRELSRWYRQRAAELGFEDGSTGAVVVVQRFGSKLNLNVHFHMLLLDGVHVADEDTDDLRWVKVPAPTTDEVQQLVARIARVAEDWLDTQGYGSDELEDDADEDADGVLLAASVAGRVALGPRAGAKVRSHKGAGTRAFRLPPRCAEAGGYNLHANVVIRQGDREGLERLCRYVLRPPLANKRLERRPDGLLVLHLRKPFSDGTTSFVFSEVELAQKLAALIPPARKNAVSYHGVLAPRHRWRNQVIPEPPAQEKRERLTKTPKPGTSRWQAWADLLWRVFEIDGLACVCGGRLVLHAVVQPPATLDVLASLRRSEAKRARAPPKAS